MDTEREALLTFKRDLIDEAHRLASWIPENKDCCKWVGIACDNATGHIHGIHLRALDGHCVYDYKLTVRGYEEAWKQRLKGGISPSLLNLKQLKHLDLSCNDFGWIHVPTFIGSFEKLRYLNLSSSNFSGVIPQQLGNLSELHTLCLGSTSFLSFEQTKIINMQWLSNLGMLHNLDLSGVGLHEATHWFQVINTLASLVQLHLSRCNPPNIHPDVPSLNITYLSFLDLSANNFNSSVPRWIFSTTSFVSLDISGCSFHSTFPGNIHSFRNLTSLKFLHADGNDFMNSSLTLRELSSSNLILLDMSNCGLSSSVFESLHNLSSLRILELFENHLTKRIPRSLGNLCNLRELGLSYNKFHNISLGDLLECFFKCKLPALESLNLWSNQNDGAIPNSMQKFSSLRELVISANQISGTIPHWIGLLSSLEYLLLEDNKLNGPIPYSIGKLSSLKELFLHLNKLNGPIPYSIGQLLSLEALHLADNQLNCSLPESVGQLLKLKYLSFSNNMLTGVVTEAHFAKLVKLRSIDGEGNSLILILQAANWIPPFQLTRLYLGCWILGPLFPRWIQSQINISALDISNTSILSPIPESFFRSLPDLTLSSIPITPSFLI